MNEELPKVNRRHRAGCYTCGELADMLDLAHETFIYHVRRGYVPAPQAVRGKRRYYSVEMALSVMAYFRGRRRYSRHE
jgi:DNA-binding transcriptional MerR regulator